MVNIAEIFGSMVFNDSVMHKRLPKDTYKALKETIEMGKSLDRSVATVVANAMKDWAIEKGATHFTHWFQPMTGITAEKHDSFISPMPGGSVIMEFSGKELIKGEPDASSFPSGGLRATFEARGYTAWDPTSYAFIKEDTLYIPTAFYSYGGEALDKKTPLLRSMEAISNEAVKVLSLLGDTETKRVITTVGPEQEYFLIDRDLYEKRKDLIYTGRTLFGSKPPKGQELEDHYFGTIRPRVQAYMKDLDNELWKLGVLAKTEHNEVAPAQHELAPIFSQTNIACDHNQLTMELMKKVALKHGLVCLLHEKPFAGVNGSGKHNNWSIATDKGVNLLEPGKEPAKNIRFLVFLSALIKAVDEHQDLLRISVASAGNDHRLGANEAPPAIISMYLGDELVHMLEAVASGSEYSAVKKGKMDTMVSSLPTFVQDTTDRNRTSPFAFTGNKFEFRMLGSMLSISGPNVILNTIVADALSQFAEKLDGADDVASVVTDIVKETMAEHKRIIFNGNNYSEEWVVEAEKRGLLNWKTTVEAIPHFADKQNIELFRKHKIFSEVEVHSRCELLLEGYCKVLNIEAQTMIDLARKEILPATMSYVKDICETVALKKEISAEISCETEEALVTKLSSLINCLSSRIDNLDTALLEVKNHPETEDCAKYYREVVFAAMQELRAVADELEILVSAKYWPYPTYGELLFSV